MHLSDCAFVGSGGSDGSREIGVGDGSPSCTTPVGSYPPTPFCGSRDLDNGYGKTEMQYPMPTEPSADSYWW